MFPRFSFAPSVEIKDFGLGFFSTQTKETNLRACDANMRNVMLDEAVRNIDGITELKVEGAKFTN